MLSGADVAGVVPEDHFVQFYADDAELAAAVGPFLRDGIAGGEGVAVIATAEHHDAFARSIGAGLAEAEAAGSYVAIDAAEMLSRITVDGAPDPAAFHRVAGALHAQVAGPGRPVRLYGEMVGLLWAAGQVEEAVQLERLWNELGQERSFSLYCAYPIADMATAEDLQSVKHVCDTHSTVLAPAGYLHTGDEVDGGGVGGVERSAFFVPVPLAARAVRRFVADALDAWGQGPLKDDAALVVTELASNVLRHADSPFRVTISSLGAGVRIAVHDASPLAPVSRPVATYAPGGRGVAIVAKLSHRWGTDYVPDGKVVWAELRPTGLRPDTPRPASLGS